MRMSPAEIERSVEWLLPLGACCAEAQADGIPCTGPAGDCLRCGRAEPGRQLLLRMLQRIPKAA